MEPLYITVNLKNQLMGMTLIFNLFQIRALLGGRMNWIIVGGAPLSRETHEFIRVCLGAIVVQVKNIAKKSTKILNTSKNIIKYIFPNYVEIYFHSRAIA